MNATYNQIKTLHETNTANIMEKNKVFFAFSKSQLEEGKQKIGITENKLLTSIGAGGFCPKINADSLIKELNKEDKRYRKELKQAKEATEQAILYELNNHESFYTQRIEETAEFFKGIYTREEIRKVFNKHNK